MHIAIFNRTQSMHHINTRWSECESQCPPLMWDVPSPYKYRLSRTWIPVPTSDMKCSLVWQHTSTHIQRDSILRASNGAGWQLCGGCFYLLCQKPWLQSLACLGGEEIDFANVAGFVLFSLGKQCPTGRLAQAQTAERHWGNTWHRKCPRQAISSHGLNCSSQHRFTEAKAEALYLFLHGGVWRTHAGHGSILHMCKTHRTHNHWETWVWNLQNIEKQPFTCVSNSKIPCWNYILKLTNRHKTNFILISSRDSKRVGIKGKFRGTRDQDFWKKRQVANTYYLKSPFRQVKVMSEKINRNCLDNLLLKFTEL